MNHEFSINPSTPNLYSYLTKCAIEQTGKHTLNGIDPDAKDGSDNDIKLINKFVELELSSDDLDEKSKSFLEILASNVKNNLKVHQTRDCQIVETGNHYVTLTFSTKKNNFLYNLRFSTKFKQEFGLFPIGSNKITIRYFHDAIFNKKIHKTEDFSDYNYIIGIDANTKCYRKEIKSKEVDIDDNIITLLPCDYLSFNQKDLEPKLNPDACTIF
jgi:hypothetical protein